MRRFMKISYPFLLITCALSLFTSCSRQPGEVWDDSKTACRYANQGMNTLGGKNRDSRQCCSREDFGFGDAYDCCGSSSMYGDDYIPLEDMGGSHTLNLSEGESIPQSRLTPGDPNGPVPSIDAFSDPDNNPALAGTFRHILFAYNSDSVKGEENFAALKKMAAYLKQKPNTYVFVEGHCDEKGPQSYNLALGMRRANTVRNYLAEQGVNPNNLFTISYGKERPASLEASESAHAANRRAQFKIYSR